MPLLIIHLSDIHLKADRPNPILERTQHIAAAIRGQPENATAYIFVVSGDTAFSGKEAEYEHAKSLYLQVFRQALEGAPDVPALLAVVPGNHDCDFVTEKSTRRLLLDKLRVEHLTDSDPAVDCLQVQQDYRHFATSLDHIHPRLVVRGLTEGYSSSLIDLSGTHIRLHLLNTAWCSRKKEKQGELLFPLQIWTPTDSDSTNDPADLVLTVLHHPYNWLAAPNARALRGVLESISDIVLTGHEHEADSYAKITSSGANLEYIEGGVLQDNEDDANSSFNILIVDPDTSSFQQRTLVWDGERYSSQEAPTPRLFERNRHRLAPTLPHRREFDDWLGSPGAAFQHPRVSALRLSDIYTFPTFREIAEEESAESAFIKGDRLSWFSVKRNSRFEGQRVTG